MSYNITVESGKSVRLTTAGKYCDRDIVVTATGGGSAEDLEALGVLCDWQVTTDSNSYPTITVVNYHPSYYLHCVIAGRGWEQYEENVVVAPNSSYSTFIEGYALSNIVPIYIENVRWKASAT